MSKKTVKDITKDSKKVVEDLTYKGYNSTELVVMAGWLFATTIIVLSKGFQDFLDNKNNGLDIRKSDL